MDLSSHVLERVLHEDGAVRVGFRHLGLARRQTIQHVVGQYDRFLLPPGQVAIVSRKHVHLPLVDTELANVRLEVEDVRALHNWVQDLSRRETLLFAAHDRATPLDPCQVASPSDVEALHPVLLRVAYYVVRRPQELHVFHVHAGGLPNLDEVLADSLDFVEVAAHLVVHQRKPIRDPELESPAGLRALVHVDGLEDTLRDVHAAGCLEAVVQDEFRLPLQECAEFGLGLALLTHRPQQRVARVFFRSSLRGCRRLRGNGRRSA
mmetsp:Transcript_45563/g.126450  ORF Transcript_45563/g.126450 Transcript_45563/m.126450 type:complete len:264 (-) Transcript_45563:291-1082(-)